MASFQQSLRSFDTNAGLSAGEEGGGQPQASIVHAAELVIDGGTLSHILGTASEQALARVGAQVLLPCRCKTFRIPTKQ